MSDEVRPYEEWRHSSEKEYATSLMRAARGRMSTAAKIAQLDRRTILRMLRRHGLDRADFRGTGQDCPT